MKFLARILSSTPTNAFLEDFLPFQRRIAGYGIFNSLAQVLIKILGPGIPDFYQGTELWDFSLVDPDNRGLVDYALRRERLAELQSLQTTLNPSELIQHLFHHADNGLIKMYVTVTALHYRRKHAALFQHGCYRPLDAQGEYAQHICGFLRQNQDQSCLIVFPRFLTQLIPDPATLPVGEQIWGQTWIPLPSDLATRSFRNVFTQEIVAPQKDSDMVGLLITNVFSHFPFALLEPLS